MLNMCQNFLTFQILRLNNMPLDVNIPMLFTHPSVDEHLGYFLPLTFVNNAAAAAAKLLSRVRLYATP